MANGGSGVSAHEQLSLGGAEPLINQQLPVGHSDLIRPSGASDDYLNHSEMIRTEEIGTADGDRKRQAEEETRSGHNIEGFALEMLNPGSEGGLRSTNHRNSPRPS